jgi:hypothetical protein
MPFYIIEMQRPDSRRRSYYEVCGRNNPANCSPMQRIREKGFVEETSWQGVNNQKSVVKTLKIEKIRGKIGNKERKMINGAKQRGNEEGFVEERENSVRPPARQKTPPRALDLEYRNTDRIDINRRYAPNMTTRLLDYMSSPKVKLMQKSVRKEYKIEVKKGIYFRADRENSSRMQKSHAEIGRSAENGKNIRFVLNDLRLQPKSVKRLKLLQF